MKDILIIEDNVAIGNVLEETLRKEGYRISCAFSGTEVMRVLTVQEPDLILLDLMLPGLSGEEVLAHITGIPVIVLSANVDIDNKVNLLRSGAVDYVSKPFHMKEFIARIASQLQSAGNFVI